MRDALNVEGYSRSMERIHLVPRTSTDKNGVTSTRWVKPEHRVTGVVSSLLGNRPVAIKKGSDQMAEDLKNEVLKAIQQTPGNSASVGSTMYLSGFDYILDAGYVNDAYKERDISMLRSFRNNAAQGGYSLDDVRMIHVMLRENGYEGPESYLSPEAMKDHLQLVEHFKGSESLLDPFARVRSELNLPQELLCYAITLPADDRAMVNKIIVDRGITDVQEAKEMLAAMKENGTALSDGRL